MFTNLDNQTSMKIAEHLDEISKSVSALGPIEDLWNQTNNIFQRSLPNVRAAVEASKQLREKIIKLLDQPKCIYDDNVMALCTVLKLTPRDKRGNIRAGLSRRDQKALQPYVTRAPWMSLAEKSPSRLMSGLIIQALISPDHEDPRDVMVALAPARYCADELKEDAGTLFDEASTFAGQGVQDTFKQFGKRSDFTLEAFGFARMDTPEGIRLRENPKF